jgi:hypothetical protein
LAADLLISQDTAESIMPSAFLLALVDAELLGILLCTSVLVLVASA